MTASSERTHRVDKFVVPEAGREEFLAAVRTTHAVLRAQPGFVRDYVLEQTSGPGVFNFVTLVEWESAGAVEGATAAVAAAHAKAGINPREIMSRHGIRADLGFYRRVAE